VSVTNRESFINSRFTNVIKLLGSNSFTPLADQFEVGQRMRFLLSAHQSCYFLMLQVIKKNRLEDGSNGKRQAVLIELLFLFEPR
jgi:hypothetical protein